MNPAIICEIARKFQIEIQENLNKIVQKLPYSMVKAALLNFYFSLFTRMRIRWCSAAHRYQNVSCVSKRTEINYVRINTFIMITSCCWKLRVRSRWSVACAKCYAWNALLNAFPFTGWSSLNRILCSDVSTVPILYGNATQRGFNN